VKKRRRSKGREMTEKGRGRDGSSWKGRRVEETVHHAE